MANFRELLKATKAQIREMTPEQAEQERGRATCLDVREADEFDQGTIPGSVFIPRGNLETQVEGKISDKGTPVVIYCAGGARSAFAAKTLAELGYTDVVSMSGGFNQWKNEGRMWVTPQTLSAEQRNRYHRHLLLPEVGDAGQQKLLQSKVLLLGAGGLGSPAAHGSLFRLEGQATVFAPYDGPCYRCLIPEPPPPELAPSCAEAGVLGVLPGIVGSIQAIEAIKVLLDLGDPLIGRLLAYDSLEQSFRTSKVNRDPICPACGENAEIVIAEYDELCLPHAVLADGTTVGH